MNKMVRMTKIKSAWLLVGSIMLLALACLVPMSVDEPDNVGAQHTNTNECFFIETHPSGGWLVTQGDNIWYLGTAVDIVSVQYTVALFNMDCEIDPPPPLGTPHVEWGDTTELPTLVPLCDNPNIECVGPILELP